MVELITTAEAARILGVSHGRVKTLVAVGRIQPVYRGHIILLAPADVDALAAELRVDSRSNLAAIEAPPEEIVAPGTGGYDPLTGSY